MCEWGCVCRLIIGRRRESVARARAHTHTHTRHCTRNYTRAHTRAHGIAIDGDCRFWNFAHFTNTAALTNARARAFDAHTPRGVRTGLAAAAAAASFFSFAALLLLLLLLRCRRRSVHRHQNIKRRDGAAAAAACCYCVLVCAWACRPRLLQCLSGGRHHTPRFPNTVVFSTLARTATLAATSFGCCDRYHCCCCCTFALAAAAAVEADVVVHTLKQKNKTNRN